MHIVAFQRPKKLPLPEFLSVTPASESDLMALKLILPKLVNLAIFADKAYADKPLNAQLLKDTNTYIFTPVKLVKGESESVRQPIESLFNWIIEKANIQDASKVRATKGLTTHIFGSIATALMFWLF